MKTLTVKYRRETCCCGCRAPAATVFAKLTKKQEERIGPHSNALMFCAEVSNDFGMMTTGKITASTRKIIGGIELKLEYRPSDGSLMRTYRGKVAYNGAYATIDLLLKDMGSPATVWIKVTEDVAEVVK